MFHATTGLPIIAIRSIVWTWFYSILDIRDLRHFVLTKSWLGNWVLSKGSLYSSVLKTEQQASSVWNPSCSCFLGTDKNHFTSSFSFSPLKIYRFHSIVPFHSSIHHQLNFSSKISPVPSSPPIFCELHFLRKWF